MDDSGRRPLTRFVDEVVEPVAASTVVLLRDGDDGRQGRGAGRRGGGRRAPRQLEVLLLERHLDADFAGGALVFPGGKVDPSDRTLDAGRWTGRPLTAWTAVLGVDDQADALGLLVAAVRETFEEAGVLFARREDGTPITDEELASPSFARARRHLAGRDGRGDWIGWLSDEELVLDLGALALWSWWVTPVGHHRRFDTRFFVALPPAGQSPDHDDVEATSLRWLRPSAALAAYERGEVVVVYPTRQTLRSLAVFDGAAAAWEAAAAGEVNQSRTEPRLVRIGDQRMVMHPDGGEPEPF